MKTQLYIGLDLHKRSSTWVGIDAKRNEVFCKKLTPNIEEVETFLSRLPAPPKKTAIALEPVCGWRWVLELCEEKGIKVHPANPKKLKEIAHSDKKTDLNDARSLANLLRAGYLPPAYHAPEKVHKLRMLVRYRSFLVSHISSLKCKIHAICTAEGEHNTSARPMLKKGKEEIVKDLRHFELNNLYNLIEKITPSIKETEKRIKEVVDSKPEFKKAVSLLMTMPGVGIVTAASIIAEVGDFKRFSTPKNLVSYAGLNPIVRATGEKRFTFRISKRGSKVLRSAIVDAAIRVRDKEESQNLYSHYERAIKTNRKSRLEARVILANKMLTSIWYMMERNVPYDDKALRSTQSGLIPSKHPGA